MRLAKKRKQGLYLAASIAVVLLTGNGMLQNSTIVKIHNVPISYFQVSVGNESGDIPFTISEGRNQRIQGEIPMEIHVSESAHVEVSAGFLRTENSSEVSEAKELDIHETSVVIWNVEDVKVQSATCTIRTNGKIYQYELTFDETDWRMRLKEN